jgi:hypothetical protein
MVARHTTIPYEFYCFTDDPAGIDNDINIKSLPNHDLSGWWWKPYIFSKNLFPVGDTNFFIDLDMVVIKNIDDLILYNPGSFCGLEDPSRVFKRSPSKLGSAVLKWTSGEFNDIWENFYNNPSILKKFRGDQDWIWYLHKDKIKFFPREWILSYKWEIRNLSELERKKGLSYFRNIRNPEIPSETSILAFHGTPSLDDVHDPIIIDNWK